MRTKSNTNNNKFVRYPDNSGRQRKYNNEPDGGSESRLRRLAEIDHAPVHARKVALQILLYVDRCVFVVVGVVVVFQRDRKQGLS
jgi:hypothetical protein